MIVLYIHTYNSLVQVDVKTHRDIGKCWTHDGFNTGNRAYYLYLQ